MSRRNPLGSSAAKRRKRDRDLRGSWNYRPIYGRWWTAATALGESVAARFAELLNDPEAVARARAFAEECAERSRAMGLPEYIMPPEK